MEPHVSTSNSKPKRVLRPRQAWGRLGIGRENFYKNFVRTGRIKLFPLGKRAKGCLEAEIERVIDEMAAEG